MKQNRRSIVASTTLLCILCAGLAFGASNGKKVKVNGLITGRDGESLTLRSTKGAATIVVVLTDDTKVQQPKGVFRHSEQSVTALIPGLRVEVEGTGTDTKVVAKSITFSKDDLLMAETIQAGLTPTKQQPVADFRQSAGNSGHHAAILRTF